jgi:hypothetical protein
MSIRVLNKSITNSFTTPQRGVDRSYATFKIASIPLYKGVYIDNADYCEQSETLRLAFEYIISTDRYKDVNVVAKMQEYKQPRLEFTDRDGHEYANDDYW